MDRDLSGGIDLIKRFEGLRLAAYKCPAGVWTIGYGHTGPDVVPGLAITEPEADKLLASDIQTFSDGVRRLVTTQVTDNQFAAMVSLAFNIGLGAFGKSTLLRAVNSNDFVAAANEFKRWIYADGKIFQGLVARRAAEKTLFERK